MEGGYWTRGWRGRERGNKSGGWGGWWARAKTLESLLGKGIGHGVVLRRLTTVATVRMDNGCAAMMDEKNVTLDDWYLNCIVGASGYSEFRPESKENAVDKVERWEGVERAGWPETWEG